MIFDVMEKELEFKSYDSLEDFLKFILYEMKSPIEDYLFVIELLKKNYFKYNDIRLAVLGAYLSSTWLNMEENIFLIYLQDYLPKASQHNKAIIFYLRAYDIYMKCDNQYPQEYVELLRNSISHSQRFVYNYVRLSEVVDKKQASRLLNKAQKNIEHVWRVEDLEEMSKDSDMTYEDFVNEFILGVDISSIEYDELFTKKKWRFLR